MQEKEREKMKAWFSALRIRQWTKNLVVFVPLVFALKLPEKNSLLLELLLASIFCAVSSAVYLVNDVIDRDRDRAHPLKSSRPVAAGLISIPTALAAAAFLLASGLGASALLLPGSSTALIAAYLVMQFFYNLGLRSIAGADIVVIALGFVLRAVAGATAIGVVFSPWLVIATFFGAARIAVGKRQAELMAARSGFRKGWEEIPDEAARTMGILTSAVLLIVYTLYCFFSDTALLVGREMPSRGILATFPPLLLSLPFVYFGLFRYEVLALKGQAGEPEFLLARDRPSAIAILGWLSVSFAALYLWPGDAR